MTSRALGLLLVAAGIAGLLTSLGGLPALPAALWVAAGVALVVMLWLRPPGRPARGQRLVATFVLALMALAGAGPLEGVVPAAVTAAAFLAVWWRDGRGWALLAGGLLATLSLSGAAATFAPAWNPAPLLFLGFAATFSLAYLLPPPWGGGRRWALGPALFFTVMTVVVNDPMRSLPDWLLPALLILGGATMLWGVRRR